MMRIKPTLRYVTLALAAFCCTAFAGEPGDRVDDFSKLKQGDALSVRFHTSGCFHDSTHELTFRRAAELTVSVVQLPRDTRRTGLSGTPNDRLDLGTLTLSKADIAGLDRLMDFYRSRHEGGCTTIDDITFTLKRDGRTVATEQIRDGSCQTYEMKRLTRFPDLIGRLDPQKR